MNDSSQKNPLVHPLILEGLPEDIEWGREHVRGALPRLEGDIQLSLLSSVTYELGVKLVLSGPDGLNEAGQMLGLAGNLDAFIVYLALFPRGEKELEMILHDSVVRPTTGPNSTAHTGRWMRAFYLNLLWRNAVVIDNILLRDYTSTLQASSTWSPPYRYAQMAALRAVYEDSPDALRLIHEAWNSVETPWDGEEHEDMLIRTELAGSEIAVLTQIHLGDEAGLNRDVAYGLRSHQRYYERTEDLQDSVGAWISLPLLGLCALAKWRGMTITVQSPFLPLDLI